MPRSPAPTGQWQRADASMSLLVDMLTGAVDQAYAEARGRDRPGAHGARRRVLVAALLVPVGVCAGTAVAQVRGRSSSTSDARRMLVADVQRQTAGSDALSRSATALRAQVSRARDQALGNDARGRSVAAGLADLEVVSGAVPVSGPGLRVTLDDAHPPAAGTAIPGAATATDPRAKQGASDGRVQDRDVQALVNGLWAAGAEAVTVNDLRLSAATAIRSAGSAILVDFRPLSPPYVVRAVGNPNTLESAFADGAAARRLSTDTSLYGFGFDIARADRLHLPAAGAADLHDAVPDAGP